MHDKMITHEPDANRYTLMIDGRVAALADYAINGSSISFHHTFTQPHLRGRGLAAEVLAFAMDDVERNSTRRVLPMCWYVADWFDEHPERKALLTR